MKIILDALMLYDLVLKKEPDNVGALVDKGVTLQNMGRLKLAIRSYDKALALSPDNLDALINKGDNPTFGSKISGSNKML